MSQNSGIQFKLHKTCGLFRCLICWRYILPDDNVDAQGDGYVHKTCKQSKEKALDQRKKAKDYYDKHTEQVSGNAKAYFRRLRKAALKMLGSVCEICNGKSNLIVLPKEQFVGTVLPQGIDRYRDVVRRSYIYTVKCRSCFAKERSFVKHLPQFNK